MGHPTVTDGHQAGGMMAVVGEVPVGGHGHGDRRAVSGGVDPPSREERGQFLEMADPPKGVGDDPLGQIDLGFGINVGPSAASTPLGDMEADRLDAGRRGGDDLKDAALGVIAPGVHHHDLDGLAWQPSLDEENPTVGQAGQPVPAGRHPLADRYRHRRGLSLRPLRPTRMTRPTRRSRPPGMTRPTGPVPPSLLSLGSPPFLAGGRRAGGRRAGGRRAGGHRAGGRRERIAHQEPVPARTTRSRPSLRLRVSR